MVGGKRHGKGTYLSSQFTYEGEYSNGLKSGFGVLKATDHSNYTGGFAFDKKEGEGEFKMANGDNYKGAWKDDKKNGKGKYSFMNGTVYEGDYLLGAKHGIGSLTFPDGSIKSGQFMNDKMEGNNDGCCCIPEFYFYLIDPLFLLKPYRQGYANFAFR